MSGKTDQVKGHAKEAAGEATDDERLQREGKMDRASGSAKEKVDQARDKVSDLADTVTGKDEK